MVDYVSGDYEDKLRRSRDFAFAEILSTAAKRVIGPSVVISAYRDSSDVVITNPSYGRHENRAFIPKNDYTLYSKVLGLFALSGDDPSERITIQRASFPAGQVSEVIRAIVEVTNQERLPFYAQIVSPPNYSLN